MAEKYISFSPYAFVGNNPIGNREIDGRYFEEGSSHETTANRIERSAEKRAASLERRADRREARGRDIGDLRDRASELRQTTQDIRDMRNDPNTMFRYATVGSNEATIIGAKGPEARPYGKTHEGHNLVYLVTEENMETRIHESRHGGQIARGEFLLSDMGTYNYPCEISAYRAQYSWDGSILYVPGNENRSAHDNSLLDNKVYGPYLKTITNINQIDEEYLKVLVDNPGSREFFIYKNRSLMFWK